METALFVALHLGVPVTGKTRFAEDLHLDSLDYLDLLNAVEGAHDVEIPAEVLGTFRTVEDLDFWLEDHAQ